MAINGNIQWAVDRMKMVVFFSVSHLKPLDLSF